MPCTLCGSNDHARAQCRWEEGTRNAIQDLINRVEGHKRNQDPPSTVRATFKAEQSFGQVGGVSELLAGIDQHHEKFTWQALGGLIDKFKDAGPEFEVVGTRRISPCSAHAYQDDQDFVGDASYGCGAGPAGETE